MTRIERVWAMPSPATFSIGPIRQLLDEHHVGENWVDPFSGNSNIAEWRNDIRDLPQTTSKQDAYHFLRTFENESVRGVLLDPPYSLRQRHECYRGVDEVAITPIHDEVARIVKPNGLAISFGWNSNGLGKKRGFELERVLLVAHGSQHNDTIVIVERKAGDSR